MDLNALNQSVLRLIENGTNIISFLKDFTVGSAKDVSITYINADGSTSVSTFANIAKMVETYKIYNIINNNSMLQTSNGNMIYIDNYIAGSNVKLLGHRISVGGMLAGETLDLVKFDNFNFTSFLIAGYASHSSLSRVFGMVSISRYGTSFDLSETFSADKLILEEHPDDPSILRIRVIEDITGFSVGLVPFGAVQGLTYLN